MAFSLSLLSLSLLPCILQSRAAAVPQPIGRRGAQLTSIQLQAFTDPAPDVPTSAYLPLTRGNAQSKSFDAIAALQGKDVKKLARRQSASGSAPLTSLGGIEYLVDITFGDETVSVIVDTGSSDTWLIQSGFTCTDSSGATQPASACKFGPTYNGTYNTIADENFSISYGDGEFVTGTVGTQDITVAGITVPGQTSALGTSAYWNGNGISSGLMGLAYPAITSAFSGTDPSADSSSNRVSYDPIFTTMYKQGLSAASFSLAIERDGSSSGGYIAFGGLPPGIDASNGSFASTPIQLLTSQGGSSDTFYTITPSALSYKGAAKTNTDQYIVDSGTSLIYLPTAVAAAVAKLYSPKATYDSSQGAYFVSCTATAPAFGVTIGGTTFTVSPKDLILQSQTDSSGKCLTGITDGGSGPYILGDTFLSNVVAVFDVGAAEMRFAPHSY